MSEQEIADALADLERARVAVLAALDDRHTFAADKVKAAAELRLIAKERLALLHRRAEVEAQRRERADAGIWQA